MKKVTTIMLSFVLLMNLLPLQTCMFVFASGKQGDELTNARLEYEQAQNDYNEYIKNNPNVEEDYEQALANAATKEANLNLKNDIYNQAQAALEQAEEDLSEKKQAYNAAVEDYNTALKVKNDKQEVLYEAETNYASAQEVFNEALEEIEYKPDVIVARAELEEAKASVKSAQDNKDEKYVAVQEAVSELSQAEVAYSVARTAADNAKSAEEPYETAVNQAQVVYNQAASEKQEADEAVETAVNAYNAARTAEEESQAAVTNAQGAVDSAQTALNQAIADKQSAQTALQIANENKVIAVQNKDDADEALETYREQMKTQLNGYQFFLWLSEKSDQTSTVKNSAAVASRMLSNQMTPTDRSVIENDGSVFSNSGSRKYYDEIIGNTNIGADGDATNWDNFVYALEMISDGNEYRNLEGLPALKVSSVMMAMGIINANYQKSLSGYSISHASAFKSLENLAANSGSSGYSAYYPSPSFKSYDPYVGWYTKEKLVYDYIKNKGWDYNSLNNTQKTEIKNACGLSSVGDVQIGHYETLTDKKGNMISTGFGYINRYTNYTEGGFYWTNSTEKYSQAFGYSGCYQNGADGIEYSTYKGLTEQFEQSFEEEENRLAQVASDAETAITAADSAIAEANANLIAANQNITNCESALNTAQTNLYEKNAVLTAKREDTVAKNTALTNARATQTEKIAAFETAQDSLETAQRNLASKQEETAKAEEASTQALANITEKQTALGEAQKQFDVAGDALNAAEAIRNEKQTTLNTIVESYNQQATDALQAARDSYDAATEELEDATNELTDKENRMNAAEAFKNASQDAKNTAASNLEVARSEKELAEAQKATAADELANYDTFVELKNTLSDAARKLQRVEETTEKEAAEKEKNDKAEAGKATTEREKEEDLEWNGTLNTKIPAVKKAKFKAAKKKVTISWTKANKKNLKKFDKVEIQVCKDKKFQKSNTKRAVVKKSKNTVTVKGLKKGAYYVRVRNVKGSGPDKLVSKWSKVKKVRIKE